MKPTTYGCKILLLAFLMIFYSCEDPIDDYIEETPPETTIPPGNSSANISTPKTNLFTYEFGVINSNAMVNPVYEGRFGNKEIRLFKTAEKQLSFYVPELEEGSQLLKFELGEITFNITKAPEINTSVIIQEVQTSITNLRLDTGEFTAQEIENISIYNSTVIELFNALEPDQKKEAAYFYEANKAEFVKFASEIFSEINASVVYRAQSDCPETDALSFYDCTAFNLTKSLNNYKSLNSKNAQLLDYLKAMGNGVILNTTASGPAQWIAEADDYSVAFGTAIYLLQLKILPAVVHLKKSNFNFLTDPWILNDDIFENVTTEFYSNQFTDLNLKTFLRTLKSSDVNLSSSIRAYIESMATLNSNPPAFSTIVSPVAGYSNKTENLTLEPSEIKLSSNFAGGYMELISFDGKKVKFKTDYYVTDLNFAYDLRIEKDGFSRYKNDIYSVLKNECELGIGSQAPDINNIEIICNPGTASSYFSLLVDFVAIEPGIQLYSQGLSCSSTGALETDAILCYPVRVFYLLNDEWVHWTQEIHGYQIISGDSKKGVLRIDVLSHGQNGCSSNASASQDFFRENYQYEGIKVMLMNKCGQQAFKEIYPN